MAKAMEKRFRITTREIEYLPDGKILVPVDLPSFGCNHGVVNIILSMHIGNGFWGGCFIA
jgi:hypothetical protein